MIIAHPNSSTSRNLKLESTVENGQQEGDLFPMAGGVDGLLTPELYKTVRLLVKLLTRISDSEVGGLIEPMYCCCCSRAVRGPCGSRTVAISG